MKNSTLLILLMTIAFLPLEGLAQKNLLAVEQAGLTGMRLPAGSKQDKRLLSVSAAGMMLDMESERLKTTLKGKEVYAIPVSAGFNEDSMSNALRLTGWTPVTYAAERGYSLWQKGKRFVMAYLEKAKKETSLYMAECASDPVTAIAAETPPAATVKPAPLEPGKTVSSPILGTWIKTSTVHYSYENPQTLTTAGYVTSQYTLQADGTYTFYAKHVSNASTEILLVRESGRYTISGNRLDIKPQASTIESWSRKNNIDQYGTLLSKQPRKFENVTYTFTEHYFSGIQEWNLVLQADKPTDRDGPFSGNTTFPNAWYFRRPAVNSTPVDLPEQQ